MTFDAICLFVKDLLLVKLNNIFNYAGAEICRRTMHWYTCLNVNGWDWCANMQSLWISINWKNRGNKTR